jgi:hypothetical protein
LVLCTVFAVCGIVGLWIWGSFKRMSLRIGGVR